MPKIKCNLIQNYFFYLWLLILADQVNKKWGEIARGGVGDFA